MSKANIKKRASLMPVRVSPEILAIILVTVFLLSLCAYVHQGIQQYDDVTLRLMTTTPEARNEENAGKLVINPPVVERAAATKRAYPPTMGILTVFFLLLSFWNQSRGANLQAVLCAIFLLLGISCSMRVLYQGFTDESEFLIVGCFVMVFTFVLWRRMGQQLSTFLYFVLAALIIFMIVINLKVTKTEDTVYGAHNWAEVGGIRLQPGEFIRAGLIVLGACSFSSTGRKLFYFLLCGVACLTLVRIKDIGAVFVLAVLVLAMTHLLFDNGRLNITLIVLGVLAFFAIYKYSSTAQDRINAWGKAMTSVGSTQQRDFISAVVRGGWIGLGIENASLFFRYFAGDTDGVVAGIQAIYGFPMLLMVIGCYGILILQCGYNRGVAPSSQPMLFQISLFLFTQLLLNYGGSLDLVPFTGITAPLLSTGGSSTLTTMALMGVMGAALYSGSETDNKEMEGDLR